jgi:ribosomal protein L40E
MMSDEKKVCTKCGKTLSVEKITKIGWGYNSWCRKCVAQAVKEGKSRHGEMPWYGKY